ncbi:aromatic acid exporter family protein [Kurthia senegalensis]|uniref:aromatic acid exporter family protein n=1 Tax=Kurthia senegalensis TaxID=1033740 RepID=UPI0002886E5D|nr:aromatic acid exporter family protein [Kurthia senegalensis]
MKKFRIGFRTVKTAVGVALAIWIASLLHLDYYTSAGILTILSIQTTKRKSIHAIYTRIVASFAVLILSYLFFTFLGYNPIILCLLILVLLPILVALKVTPGFVSSSVILLHIFNEQNFTLVLLENELLIMLIGFGIGFLVNMQMPDIEKELNAYRIDIEEAYSKIFAEVAKYLREGDTNWNGSELLDAQQAVNKGKALAYQDVENHITRKENLFYRYFDIREQQLEIIERILPEITNLPTIVKQAHIIADFLEDLSEHVHSGNTAVKFRGKLAQVKKEFKDLPLPKTHEQFVAMASLYQFIEEMDQYLSIKQTFKGLTIKKGKPVFGEE